MQHRSLAPTVPPSDAAESGRPDLDALRVPLLRYARSRVRNVTLAEDAVSETLLAALQLPRPFPTHAQATAWVCGILRHKLVDPLRQQGREMPTGDELPESDTRSLDWYVGGAWCGVAGVQREPEQACSQRQFMTLLLHCCDRLPATQRQALVQRELRCDEPAEIGRRLGITEGHLWVLVHRARVRLRVRLSEPGGCRMKHGGRGAQTGPTARAAPRHCRSTPGWKPRTSRCDRRAPAGQAGGVSTAAAGRTRRRHPSPVHRAV